MIVVGSVSSLAVLMMVIMLFVLYFRKGTKKLPPADVIPEVSASINNELYFNAIIPKANHLNYTYY